MLSKLKLSGVNSHMIKFLCIRKVDKVIITNIIPQFNSIIDDHSLHAIGTWNRKAILIEILYNMTCGISEITQKLR